MSGCSDKKFEKMLHAYELGMLSESEREELELHLMDCEYCFRQVQQFEKAGTLLRDDPEVRSTLVEITEKSDNRPSPVSEMKPVSKRKYWPTLVPVSIAAVIVFFFLVLKDWNIQLQPSQEAVASTNRLAIMYFDQLNRTDSTADLSDIITSLLITDLSESQYLEVVSSQRLYDILKLMGKEGLKNIDKNIATEVAEKARARWILTGDIIELANKITITAQLVEMESGQSIASQKVTGDSLKTIFELVDELSAEIKRDLPLPMAAFEEPDRQIADVTTHSREAYQLYLEGKELYNKFYSTEAREKFEQALAYDSTFAMAYHELAYLKDARLIDKAMQYINHASQKEKFYIRSTKAMASKNMNQGIAELEMLLDRYPDEKEAMYKLGRYKYNLGLLDESESYFNRAIEIDPLYKVAYNNLAYTYQAQGNFEKALWAINQYIALAPDEANPYDTRGEILLKSGMLDEAIASYETALQKKPDFYSSLSHLEYLYILKGEFEKARPIIERLLYREAWLERATGRLHLIYSTLYQGHFQEALSLIDSLIPLNIEEYGQEICPTFRQVKATILNEQNDFEGIRKELDLIRKVVKETFITNRSFNQEFYVQYLADYGHIQEAEVMADELKDSLIAESKPLSSYWYAVGCIAFARNDYESATKKFEKSLEGANTLEFPFRFMLGRTLQKSGRLSQAVEEFEKTLKIYYDYRLVWSIWSVKTYYYLGQVYEENGQYEKALANYERFADFWKNGDAKIKELEDARTRIKQLQNRI